MKDYKSGSHAVWDCKYHLVWITKYRYPVLQGEVGERARELLREISRSLHLHLGSGLAFCLLCSSDKPTDTGNRKPELPGNGTHAQGTLRVGPVQRFLSGRAATQPLVEAARFAPLYPGDVAIGAVARFGQCLHALDESLVAQIDLLSQGILP